MTKNTPKTIKNVLKTRAGITFTVVAAVLITVLTAIPIAVKHVAISWLLKNGMSEAHIDNVDINPFAGTFAIEGVQLRALSGEQSSLGRFSVNLAMTGLVKKHARIETLQLEGLRLVVDQGEQLTIGGLTLPAGDTADEVPPAEQEETPEKPWLMGIDTLSIKGTSVALSIPKLALRMDLDDVSLTNLHAWDPDAAARLEITGALNKSPLLISLDLTPFSATPAARGGIQLNAFSLSRLHRMAEPHITALRGDLTIDTSIAITHDPENGTTLSQTGTLSLSKLGGSMDAQGIDLNTFDITWLGDLWAAVDSKGNLTDLRTLGRLANTRFDAILSQMNLQVRHGGMIWDGEMRLQPELEDGITSRGHFTIKNASTTDTKTDKKLAGLDHLFVYDLKTEGLNSIRTPHIALNGLHALPPLAAIGSIDLTGIALKDLSNLHAETLIIGGVATSLERDPSGQLTFLKDVAALTPPQAPEKETEAPQAPLPGEPVQPEAPKEPAFTFQIGTFRMEGEKLLRFTDQSVTPFFTKTIKLKRFELWDIDSTAPDKDVPLTLETELGPYETITISGTIRPFAPKVTANLSSRIANIDLAPLSPYSSQALGYLIETGTFTAETKLAIEAGIMDIANQLTLQNLEMVPDDKERMDQVMKSLTMPLDFAFSILKDKNNTINLDIPVQGDMNDPDISIGSVIGKAMTKAITMASVSYLAYMIQPYGAILVAAEAAGEYTSRIRLDPVAYPVGSIQPTPASLDYLKVVANIMKEKEVLVLTVCANAVTDDIVPETETAEGTTPDEEIARHTPEPAPTADSQQSPPPQMEVDKALYMNLARDRANAVRDVLVNEGVDPARIILCHPHFTVAEQKKPEAMLTM